MGREVQIVSIGLFARFNACAHSCQYCNMGKKRIARLSQSRFARLVERFAEWRDRERPDLRMAIGTGYSDESDAEGMRTAKRLRQRVGGDSDRMHLGGLKMRTDQDHRAWFQERYDAGLRFANASYAGTFEVHDGWNKRTGDFQHLLTLQTIAAETGMDIGQYLFVARNTLTRLEPLLDCLEDLPKQATERRLVAFGYIGWGRRLEEQRISEEHRNALPDRLRALLVNEEEWKSEREWSGRQNEMDGPARHMLRVEIDDSSIDRLEAMDCGTIVEDLMRRTTAAYSVLPTWEELRERWADPTSTRIYAGRQDMERKWLDSYFSDNPAPPDLHLTHLSMQH